MLSQGLYLYNIFKTKGFIHRSMWSWETIVNRGSLSEYFCEKIKTYSILFISDTSTLFSTLREVVEWKLCWGRSKPTWFIKYIVTVLEPHVLLSLPPNWSFSTGRSHFVQQVRSWLQASGFFSFWPEHQVSVSFVFILLFLCLCSCLARVCGESVWV